MKNFAHFALISEINVRTRDVLIKVTAWDLKLSHIALLICFLFNTNNNKNKIHSFDGLNFVL